MRIRSLALANLLLAAMLVGTLGFMFGQSDAEGRPGGRAQQPLKVAVVDLSVVFEKSQDIEDLQKLMTMHRELGQLQAQVKRAELQRLQQELEALQEEEGSQEWERTLDQYQKIAAESETLGQVLEYRQRLDFAKHARAIFEKILYVVDLEATGKYDLVLKNYSASAEELDMLERAAVAGDMNRLLSFHQARTILYRAPGDRVPDITDLVLGTMSDELEVPPNDYNVSAELETKIADMQRQIDELQQEVGTSSPTSGGNE